jgi:5'-nucleotidase
MNDRTREGEREREPEVAARIVVDAEPVQPGPNPRVLVTNDDGIDSPGIIHLARALAARFDVTVAAPDRDWSGSGTGIGRFEATTGVGMRRVDIGVAEAYALDGPPGLAVMAAALGAFGERFDVVVSGVNAGINTGHSVIHSGTVGAALTARTMGMHGVAVSAAPGDPWQWGAAADIAVAATCWIVRSCPTPAAVNLNVPARPVDEVQGVRTATLDRFGYFRVAAAGSDRIEFEVSSDDHDTEPGSDTALLREGWATITALGTLTTAVGVLPDDVSEIWSSR